MDLLTGISGGCLFRALHSFQVVSAVSQMCYRPPDRQGHSLIACKAFKSSWIDQGVQWDRKHTHPDEKLKWLCLEALVELEDRLACDSWTYNYYIEYLIKITNKYKISNKYQNKCTWFCLALSDTSIKIWLPHIFPSETFESPHCHRQHHQSVWLTEGCVCPLHFSCLLSCSTSMKMMDALEIYGDSWLLGWG